MAEMPHYEELKEKYRDNPAVAFVSLSIDDGAALWKKSVESRKANGIQWLINRNTLNDYDIVSIPRSLLIDKEFKMVDMNAPMPSSKEIITLIDNLIR
jgi:thiol-disulfide isomerase/thioredoxin